MEPLQPPWRPAGGVVDDVALTADDRLDLLLAAGGEQLDRAVHDAVVGEAQGGLPELRGAGRERVDLARPVEQRVLGVDVEMGADGGHQTAAPTLEADPDGAAGARRARARFT